MNVGTMSSFRVPKPRAIWALQANYLRDRILFPSQNAISFDLAHVRSSTHHTQLGTYILVGSPFTMNPQRRRMSSRKRKEECFSAFSLIYTLL